jgi:predicted RNA-binding Zn-ribbon protein involved in translation (DUF1610 family)
MSKKNTQIKELPIGSSYLCHSCGHTDGDINNDDLNILKCPQCGKTNLLRQRWGKSEQIVFIFTYKVEKKVTSVWEMYGAYESDLNEDYNKVEGIKCIFTWSIYQGIHLKRIDGLTIPNLVQCNHPILFYEIKCRVSA